MKKPYQIESQQAVKRLERMAAEGNPAVPLVLPMAETLGWLRRGVGELIRQAGLKMMELMMEEEVRALVGERSQPQPERRANRWGTEQGYCVVMGQKVPIERPRVRTTEDREVAGYSCFAVAYVYVDLASHSELAFKINSRLDRKTRSRNQHALVFSLEVIEIGRAHV